MIKIILIIFTFISISSYAKEEQNIIYISNLTPWLTVKNDHCQDGLICNFFKKVLSETSFETKYVTTSVPRANSRFYKGEQFIALYPYDKKLKGHYHLMGKVLDYRVGLVISKLASSHNYKNETVCITRDNPHKTEHYKYLEVNSYHQCFQMLKRDRIKLIMISDIELKTHLESKSVSRSDYSKFNAIASIPLWFYINKSIEKTSPIYRELLINFKSFDTIKFQSESTQI
jgi:hypothetical protein